MPAQHELVVRINGNHAAFGPIGRSATRQPKVCTSVSFFVFKDGRRAHHTLLDVGPGVCEAIQREDLFPFGFPIDRVILSHSHTDHFLSLDTLCGDYHWWSMSRTGEPAYLPILATSSVYEETVKTFFPFQEHHLQPTSINAGEAFTLWEDGDARLQVTLLEVVHFRRSTISLLTFSDGSSKECEVVCLFDFGDFHPPDKARPPGIASPDDARFHGADLMVAEATSWQDPVRTVGKPSAHVSFEKLAEYLCRWQPVRTRIVHYAGYDDLWSGDDLGLYWEKVKNGQRIHPREGPTSSWELTLAMQQYLQERGFRNPGSVRAADQAETIVAFPGLRPPGVGA